MAEPGQAAGPRHKGPPPAVSTPDVAAEAAAFALSLRHGGRPTVAKAMSRHHLMMLHALLDRHPLAACRHYAASPDIPWQKFAALDNLRQLILHSPRAADPALPAPSFTDRSRGIILCPRPGADRVLFVFTGRANQFGGPLRLLHRWFAQLGVSVVYLVDWDWSYYLGPLRGAGAALDDNIRALREIMRQIGATSCLCLGNSGGGFGALLYGPRLGATRTLAYAAPTAIRESLDMVRAKTPGVDALLSPEGAVDLAFLLARGAPPPPARLFFGAGNAHDSAEAQNLARTPQVRLLPLDGVTEHGLIPLMVSRGVFAMHLDWLMEG